MSDRVSLEQAARNVAAPEGNRFALLAILEELKQIRELLNDLRKEG